ncbi:hypothetical protein CDL15_Pgr010428 [Punica granatum]|uniref:Subtilisin-like protease fibronectin type-III domain-containing protein n=1 Tax=Punica granatum TaxID=22663 RepID=A0A218W1Y8_PUNGR|nr:hypothetical protein CDL15_Pgr010428 [Punica granatum]
MTEDGFFHVSCILAIVFLSINSIVCSVQGDDRKASIGPTLQGHCIEFIPIRSDLNNSAVMFGKQVSSSCDEALVRACKAGCLDMWKVYGKIVICEGYWWPPDAAVCNASRIILKTKYPDTAQILPLPAMALDNSTFEKLVSYLSSMRDPQGRILTSEAVPNPDSPVTASFSSRGPNVITPDIMKPDISGPGIGILAAFPPRASPSEPVGDDMSVKFNIQSETSMVSPMVAGQINPAKAVDPGLVYEITKADYVNLLCSSGFDIRRIDSNSTCPKGAKNITQAELNYPSLTFKAPVSKPFKLALDRTIMNVGPPSSTYKAKAVSSSNINITVVPVVIFFKSISEKKTFTIEISSSGLRSGTQLSEEVVFSDELTDGYIVATVETAPWAVWTR